METSNAAELLAALGHDSRLSVFRLLVEAGPEGLFPTFMGEQLGMPAATLSFHLSHLSRVGLIRGRKESRFIRYSAEFTAMDDLISFLTRNCCQGKACLPKTSACDTTEKRRKRTCLDEARQDRPQAVNAGDDFPLSMKGNSMKTLDVFDPAMCCSTGVCGVDVDPVLVQFAADLKCLEEQGVSVTRHNLGQEPQAFAANPAIVKEMEEGMDRLPILAVNGKVISIGLYPSRQQLAQKLGIALDAGEKPADRTGSCSPPKSGCC